jgi:hypothetical protein
MVRRLESVFGEGVALEELRVLVRDGRAAMGARRQALASLNDARVGDLREICVSVLGVRELAGEAMRGLAASGDAAAGGEVLGKFRGFDAEGKAAALDMLGCRVEWSVALLEAVRAGNDLVMICHRIEMVEQAHVHLQGLEDTVLDDALRRIERAKKRMAMPDPWSRSRFDKLNEDVWKLRVDTLGEEKAAVLSVEDGKRSPVELY